MTGSADAARPRRRRWIIGAVSALTLAVHIAPSGNAVFAWAAHEAFHLWEDLFHEHDEHSDHEDEHDAPGFVHRHGSDGELHAHSTAVDLALRALDSHDGTDRATAPHADHRVDKHVPPDIRPTPLLSVLSRTPQPAAAQPVPDGLFRPPTPPPRT